MAKSKNRQRKPRDLEFFTSQVTDFLNSTDNARRHSETCRDFYNHKHYTESELQEFKRRFQMPVVVNRVRPKIDGLVGLYNIRETDPKAFPRTMAHDEFAFAVTDALRFVKDNTRFGHKRLLAAEDYFIEGYTGAMVRLEENANGEVEVAIDVIPWDRIYFDPRSRELDFSDAGYMGVMVWMGVDALEDMADERGWSIDFDQLMSVGDEEDETFEDCPREGWVDRTTNRVRLAHHFYRDRNQWNMTLFAGNQFIVAPDASPFLDEYELPTNPIELVACNIDRDNDRFGEVTGYLDQQREINYRRAKFLHLLSSRQSYARDGAIPDVRAFKNEASKPHGHLRFLNGEWGKDVGFVETGDMAHAQFTLYQDGKAEIDAIGYNAQLAGNRQTGDLSGRAIDRLQKAGTIELNPLYDRLVDWENRIYRQSWARVRQAWTKERWVRITDDQDTVRWVGFNQEVTLQQRLEETVQDDSLPILVQREAAEALVTMTQAEDPRLQEIVTTENPVGEMDVDIVIDQSHDIINIQQEQFELLLQFAQGRPEVTFEDMIELSDLRNKKGRLEKLKQSKAAQQQAAGNQEEMTSALLEANVAKAGAEAAKSQEEAFQKRVETEIMLTTPDQVSVSV